MAGVVAGHLAGHGAEHWAGSQWQGVEWVGAVGEGWDTGTGRGSSSRLGAADVSRDCLAVRIQTAACYKFIVAHGNMARRAGRRASGRKWRVLRLWRAGRGIPGSS